MDDIRDDEIRVIGAQSRKTLSDTETSSEKNPKPLESSRRKKLLIWLAHLAILLLIGILFLLLRSGKKLHEDPYDGVFEPKEEVPVQPIKKEKRLLGHETDSLTCYTERIDTVINDVRIAIFIPHNATPELIVGKPDDDSSIILAAQAADIRADNKEILGAFVYKGTPLAWGLSKKGFCAIIDGKMTIGTSENSPLFEQATETGGYFFRQFPLIDKGVLVENELKNKSVRKALCSRLGQVFIAVTEFDESYHDFSQALIDLGVDDAISLVGSKYAFGWCVNEKEGKTLFAQDVQRRTYKNENYIIWRAE